MASSENNDTVKLAQELLDEIRETQTDFAAIKTELHILHENVKGLSRLVRDGNGDMSILTKLALLNQKIEDIIKWKDGHHDAHQRIKKDISNIHQEIEDLERKLIMLEKDVAEHEKKIADKERIAKEIVEKKIELAHEQKISNTKVKEERQKIALKIIAAVIVTVLTFIAGYFAKL